MILFLFLGMLLTINVYLVTYKDETKRKKIWFRVFYSLGISISLCIYLAFYIVTTEGSPDSVWNDIKLIMVLFLVLLLTKIITTVIIREELEQSEYTWLYNMALISFIVFLIIQKIKGVVVPMIALICGELLSHELSTISINNIKDEIKSFLISVKENIINILISVIISSLAFLDYRIENEKRSITLNPRILVFLVLGILLGGVLSLVDNLVDKNLIEKNK